MHRSGVDVRSLERLIKARFHRWVMDTYGGFWERASEDVEAVTGVQIPHETLRQNIEPVSQKAGLPPRRIKDLRRLEALKDFLVEKKYLRETELSESGAGEFAASALSIFLNGEDGLFVSRNLEKFRGRFEGERYVSGGIESIELQIDYVGRERPTKMSEVSSLDDGGDGQFNDRVESEGWIVCNEQGFHIAFLRDALASKCYLVLQSSPALSSDQAIKDLAFLHYDTAWAGELQTAVPEANRGSRNDGFRLPKGVDEMCFFLTRV